MAGQVRQEELLAKAFVIDGRKEWFCRFRSETDVWSIAKCRRCKADIPAGMHGKHLQETRTLACKAQVAKDAEFRELREKVRMIEKKPDVQFEDPGDDSKAG